jgi:ferredoxin-NADP reductase
LKLVVAAYDGFTDDLHNFAIKHPGASLRASFDGPYGTVPNFAKSADKVIFVAGGSGASFTFGVALDMVRKLNRDLPKPKIEFIWTVREPGKLAWNPFNQSQMLTPSIETFRWFSKELKKLRASPRVNVILHSTRLNFDGSPPFPISPAMSPIIPEDKSDIPSHTPMDDEKHRVIHPSISHSPLSASSSRFDHFPHDLEKHTTSLTNITHEWDLTLHGVLPGRPDVETLIKNLVASAGDEERIAIAACGPDSLMWTVRRTATNAIRVNGPSIELHCEQFGW